MSNIFGLSSLSKKKEEKKDNEEFSVGGHTSSTAVMRPTGMGGSGDPLQDIIRNARAPGSADPQGARDRGIGIITIYANGFILGEDGGEFRDSSDPKNADFIKSLKDGHVPRELEADVRKKWGQEVQSVGVSLVDKSSETYTPPKPKFSFATSHGTSLGGSTSAPVDLGNLKPAEYKLDNLQPKTTIQVVLANRQKLRLTVNMTATVAEVYQHVMFVSGVQNFSLSGGFPPKPLNDYSMDVKTAGLAGASVTQRV